MGGDPWNIKSSDNGKLPTLLENSTLDRGTINEIASGHRQFPNYDQIPLTPQRRLLHEVIIQVVTERQLVGPNITEPHDARLHSVVEEVIHAPAYRQMLAQGNVDPAKVSELLDSFGLQRLPTVGMHARTTVMMATGGPATGKSALVANLAEAHPEVYRSSAIVNSDDYKPLLADPKIYGAGYANAAHAESAFLSDEILTRLSHKFDVGRAPNVMLDVVTLSDQRMAFAQKSGNLIVATGTAPPSVTLERSEERGIKSGRVVPSEAVLAGSRAVSATTPRIFEHSNAHMELFDTNVPYQSPHKLVAKYDAISKTLIIHQPDTFVDFVERQNLNAGAKNESELFRPADRTPATIASEMKVYTDRGVTLAFLNPQGELAMSVSREGVDQFRPLSSDRGKAFFAELAGAATALAGRQAIDSSQRAQVDEHAPGEPRKTQTPIPILVPQNERGLQQNPIPIFVPQNERAQTPPPVLVARTLPSPELPPERVPLPGKIGIAGAAAQLAIGPAFEATLAAANDGNAHDVGKAALHGLANSALPGVADGFKNITQNNNHQNWVDQTLNAGTTATQGVAVGSLAVAGGSAAAAPITGGASLTVTAGSLVVAGVSGVANLGIGLVHDATYVTGVSKQGGVVTGLINMGSQLLDSKAAHRAGDWMMGNDAKVQQELAAKGIRPNQLTAVDENHDGKVSAQETRDYLIKHRVAVEQVNSLPAKELADKLVSVIAPAPHVAHAPTQPPAHQPTHQALSPDMLRALTAAKAVGLTSAVQFDGHHDGASVPAGIAAVPRVQGTAQANAGRH